MGGLDLRIALIGPGSIGGATAALLARAGIAVEVVCKSEEVAEHLRTTGMRVSGARGEFTVPLRAVSSAKRLSGPKEIILLATKATDMLKAVRAALPFLDDDGVLVSLQNGVCVDALGKIVGAERVVGCVVSWAAMLREPGWVEITTPGEFVVGAAGRRIPRALPIVREVLAAVMPTRISKDIHADLYAKLVLNSCFNALAAATGTTFGQLASLPRARAIAVAAMGEAVAVADSMGLRLPRFNRILDFHWFLRGKGPIASAKRDVLLRAVGAIAGRSKPSTLQSLERGRPTEIDFLNGYVCARGKEHRVATPVNDQLVALVHSIEKGERAMALANIDDVKM